jgi:hypothetical protein
VSAANCTSEIAVNCFCIRSAQHALLCFESWRLTFHSRSPTFTKEMVICISSQCYTELASAESLGQQFCNLASTSISLSYPFASHNVTSSATPALPTSTPVPSTTLPSTTSPTSKSAARGTEVPWNVSWLVVSVGVGVIGVVYGVFIV